MTRGNDLVRELLLCDGVDNSTVRVLIEKIREINREDDFKTANVVNYDRTKRPIVLTVNTTGGIIHSGQALVDTILTSKTPVHTEALGLIASMGIPIYLAGTKRTAHEHALFMLHEPSYGQSGTVTEHERRLQVLNKFYRERINKFILSRTNISEETLLSHQELVKDWYFDTDEAIKLGVAHQKKIITRLSTEDVKAGNFVVE